jgi:hypothetical protein
MAAECTTRQIEHLVLESSGNLAQSLSERFLGYNRRRGCRCCECCAFDQPSNALESHLSVCLQMMGDRGERREADIKRFVSPYETKMRKTELEAPV